MKACVRHWKIHYGGFWHHFLDFRRLPIARLQWGYESIVELVRQPEAIVKRNTWEGVVEAAGAPSPFSFAKSEVGWRKSLIEPRESFSGNDTTSSSTTASILLTNA